MALAGLLANRCPTTAAEGCEQDERGDAEWKSPDGAIPVVSVGWAAIRP
jgi:hypothetical protein